MAPLESTATADGRGIPGSVCALSGPTASENRQATANNFGGRPRCSTILLRPVAGDINYTRGRRNRLPHPRQDYRYVFSGDFSHVHECVARHMADPARKPTAAAITREPVKCRWPNLRKPVNTSLRS